MSDREAAIPWDQLLTDIHKRQVLPIIGPALVTLDEGSDKSVPLIDAIVPDFACQIELTGNETVDLTEPVREDILLALPPHPHCDWNGERECKAAFRKQSETPEEPLSDTREVWGALDQLKLK